MDSPLWRSASARAVRQCQTRIEQAAQPADVDRALRTLLAKRFGLSAAADSAALVGALRSDGYRNVAVRCERIFEQCEQPLASGLSLADLKREAIQVIGDLAIATPSSARKPAPSITASRLQSSTSTIVAAVVLAGACWRRAASRTPPTMLRRIRSRTPTSRSTQPNSKRCSPKPTSGTTWP